MKILNNIYETLKDICDYLEEIYTNINVILDCIEKSTEKDKKIEQALKEYFGVEKPPIKEVEAGVYTWKNGSV